ncbi:MAG: glycosyltransferase family 2 protein, partial [Acidobacteria bacterium]|nr:glycosyltransferase family 2 protein [Acidobacteriota bacterium]
MKSRIDLLIVVHNSRKLIPPLIASLRTITVPVTGYFLDNDSRDGTADLLATE